MRNSYLLTLLSLILCTSGLHAQSNGKSTGAEYQKEWLYGLNFNTNGGLIGGLMFKYARAMTPRTYQVLSVEAVHIKHPKERRATIVTSGRSFIPGKINHLYAIRPTIGLERIFFKKAREKGVQVSGLFSVGPSLGIVAPYIIEYDGQFVAYDPSLHGDISKISGVGFPTDGLGDAKFELGGTGKASLFFEMGTGNKSVAGFEVGMTLDYYSNKINLLDKASQNNVYPAGFITFYYGLRR